jgi:diacylglycerol kinase (ATP)
LAAARLRRRIVGSPVVAGRTRIEGASKHLVKPNPRIIVIENPVAGSARGRVVERRMLHRLRAEGARLDVLTTAAPDDARRFARTLPAETDLVIVVGGDGTVNEVVDGLLSGDVRRQEPSRRPPIFIVPRGTENLLAKSLGLSIEAVEKTLLRKQWHTAEFDVGVAGGRRFLCVLGVGFDAQVLRHLLRRRRGHITHFDYFWPLWRTFWEWRFPPLRVEMDDRLVFDGRGLAFVGNISRYALGLRILRDARPDDGLLDVCVYACERQVSLLRHSAWTAMGRQIGRRGVIYQRGRRVRISSNRPLPVEVDGELFGATPIECSVEPRAVRFVTPAG